MKNLIFYPGASPQHTSPKRWLGLAMSIWLAFFITTATNAQVSITCPGTITISCSVAPDPSLTGQATATTGCSTSPSVNITHQDDTSLLNGCMGTGVLRRTWTATDQCGQSATCIQNIVIEDSTSPTLTCPAFVTISCEADTSPVSLGFAIATDNCTPANLIAITYSDHTQNLNQCNGTGSFTRHWQAVDMCGNVAACIQTIVITDTKKPILTIPASVTINCNDSSNPSFTGTATATDNCTPVEEIVVAFSDNVLGLSGCNGTGSIVRTWSAADACQNVSFGTQFITVIDNTPPSITCPPNITVSCESSILPEVTGTATATDLCGQAFVGYTDLVLGSLGCNGTGIIERTWTAIDPCSNIASCVQIIVIEDKTLPTITCPQNITVDCAAGILPAVTGQPVVSDNCTPVANLQVTYSDVNIVPPGCNGTTTLRRTWRVNDACGNSSTCNQIITVTDLLKPTIFCPAPITISCESPRTPEVTGAASATDNCTPVSSLVITFVDNTSGLIGCNGTGILKRTWTATDLCGNESSCVQDIWIVDDTDPVIICPKNIEISCSDSIDPSFTGRATATDNCTSNVTISYTDVSQLNGCNSTGIILRTWSAQDACGNVKTCMQLITITDKEAPQVICPRDTIIDCGFYNNPDALGYPTGIDNCTPSDELILDYDDDLSGLTGCTNTGVILRTWYMQDACGNIGSCVQKIIVADTTEPVINCPPDRVVSCNESISPNVLGKATATDYCTASLFIDIAYTDDTSEAGLCNGSGTIYRTWTATDDCGNVASCVQVIEIIDDVAPEITCPASYAISCEADRSPESQGKAFATDNCTADAQIIITYKDDTSELTGCNGTGNLYRTWTAIDACGNKSTCVQVMTITDTKKPVLTAPANITISCESSHEESVTGSLTATDNCTAASALSIEVSDDLTSINGCNNTGTLKRTWVVTDACGNSASATQQIRIVDTTAPTIICGASLQVSCGESLDPSVLGSPEIFDNCTPAADMDLLHFDNTTGLNGCSGTGTLYRTWVAFDDCGNSSSCIQTIEVVDNIGPEITLPADLTISCEYRDDDDELGYATATDGCTPANQIEISYKDNDLGLALCNSTGLRQRTWTAIDLCGNSSTAIQYIQFIDTLAPIFYTPFDVTIECGDHPLNFDLTGEVDVWTDNCANVQDIQITYHDDLENIENCNGNPVINRIWSLTDPCGNVGSSIQKITVMNYSMDQVIFPGDIDIACDQDVMDFGITGQISMPDNACTYLIDTMYTEEMGEIAPYVYQRKWVCIDYCGHVEEQMQTINLIDNEKPVLSVKDVHISFAVNQEIHISVDDVVTEVIDNCDGDVAVALSQEVYTCDDFLTSSEQILTITATDDQGNVTIEKVAVVLEGGLFLMECPQDINVYLQPGECFAEISYAIAPVGLCNQDPVVTQIDASGLTSGDGFPIGTTRQMYAITDQLGYTTECAFNVNVFEFADNQALACQDILHVSVVFECEAVITADMLLEGNHYGCYDDYIITFTNPSVVFENGVLFAEPWINQYLEACITDPTTGNYCCSQLLIEDKLPPVLECSDITLSCIDDIAPHAIPHFPVPDNAIVTPLGGNKYQVIGIDNCGATTISYTDVHDLHMCDGIYADIVTRTWVAVDESGHTATCTEQLFLERGTIEDFTLPGDTTIYCGNSCIRPDRTPDPACIGGIEGPFCGTFFIGYIDKVIEYCGASYAVKREWSLVDWCTGQVIDHEQIINVADTSAPILVCPEVIQVPAGFNQCGAEIVVPLPDATDECGGTPLHYTLIYNGQEVPQVNGEFTLPFLVIGSYFVTWEVRDDCGNLTTCETVLELYDNTPPTAYCDKHTVISINNQDPFGVALLPATTLDDGSFDNCGPVTFRARRMSSCISFDWTTNGHNHIPDGDVDAFDQGTAYNDFVPVSCCDVSENYILVELEVTDLRGNKNYCMVQVQVQDKLAPIISCPPDITVSCDFWFDPDVLTHPDNRVFGTVVDGFQYDESERQPIVINDPGNTQIPQPHVWGIDGYVKDNCNLEMDIRVTILDDCSGDDLPAGAPDGAVKLIQRRFTATDPSGRTGFCTQRIWVVNFDPFYINTQDPNDPTDDVVWPADIELDHCGIPDTVYPIILNDNCSQIGINLKERRFEHTEGACVKILRDWTIIDWCQYDAQAETGLWKYTQVVKITDDAGVLFTDCTNDIRRYCELDEEVTPVTNPAFQTSCFVHLNLRKLIEDVCSEEITFDVKIYAPNSSTFIQAVPPTDVQRNGTGTFELWMNTATSPNLTLRNYGLEYNNPTIPNQHYKILWTVVDGCGNVTTCEDRVRLEDCKQPTPVCINGLSTVPMPSSGSITIWAKDFDASSFDNCTPEHQLKFSFSGDTYQPSRTFTCEEIIALGVELPIQVWVWDAWNNKDYCQTTILFTDPTGVCGLPEGGVGGIIETPDSHERVAKVGVHLIRGGEVFGSITTNNDGTYHFPVVPAGSGYSLEADRNDNPRNGVTTLDLVALQKHILGSAILSSPYKLIAADANGSGTISAIDLVEIRKLILGKYTEFPNNKSWRFIPANYQFIDPYNPFPFEEISHFTVDNDGYFEDFMGVKVGDLNQSVEANFNSLRPRSSNTIAFSALDQEVEAGQVVNVSFDIHQLADLVSGGQWELQLKNAIIKNIALVAEGMTEEMYTNDERSVRVSWVPTEPVFAGELMTLTIEAIQSGKLSEMISLDNSWLSSEVYDANEEIYQLQLNWLQAGQDEVAEEIQLYQNQPNPWGEETVIPFDIPEAGEVTISITTAIGVEVTSNVRHFSSGKQQWKIRNEGWAPGLYYYTLRYGDIQLTKTMLILNKR